MWRAARAIMGLPFVGFGIAGALVGVAVPFLFVYSVAGGQCPMLV